jgi:hypothetical protein
MMPAIKPVRAISAMRPSMMTLVSSRTLRPSLETPVPSAAS